MTATRILVALAASLTLLLGACAADDPDAPRTATPGAAYGGAGGGAYGGAGSSGASHGSGGGHY